MGQRVTGGTGIIALAFLFGACGGETDTHIGGVSSGGAPIAMSSGGTGGRSSVNSGGSTSAATGGSTPITGDSGPGFFDDEPCSERRADPVYVCHVELQPRGFEKTTLISGTVTSFETKPVCEDRLGPAVTGYHLDISQEDAAVFHVELALGSLPLSLAVGDAITFTVYADGNPFRRSDYSIRRGGKELLHVVQDGRFEDEPPHAISLSYGPVTCEGRAYCGTVRSHDLVASDGTDSVEIPTGKAARVGDYEVYSAGAIERDGSGCGDWFSTLNAAWVPASP